MPLDHRCEPRHGVRYACEFLPHNNPEDVNPVQAWQGWVSSALAAGDIMELCKGKWHFEDELVLSAPVGWGHQWFRGQGPERSKLVGRKQGGSVLTVTRAGGSRFEKFSVETWMKTELPVSENTVDRIITWGGQQLSACHVEDVWARGSVKDGAFGVTGPNANDCTFTRCRMHAWDHTYVPGSQNFSERSALKLDNTRNHQFAGCEIHSFVSSSVAVLGVGSVSQVTFNGRVWSVSTTPGEPWGYAQARFMGPTRGLVFVNDVMECEPIQVPGAAPGVAQSHAPTYGLYFDQGVSGLEMVQTEVYVHHALLASAVDTVIDQANVSGTVFVNPPNPTNAWALSQPQATNTALTTIRNSDISCAGLPLRPGGSIDRDTRLRAHGGITLRPGATDQRAVV